MNDLHKRREKELLKHGLKPTKARGCAGSVTFLAGDVVKLLAKLRRLERFEKRLTNEQP